jgi:hypothetical protein
VNEPQYDPTTLVRGAPGVAPIVVRDHDGWVRQVAAANRAAEDARIAATVAEIRQADEERQRAPSADLADLVDGMRANAALAREQREAPERTLRELAQTEALVSGLAATLPPPPDPGQARRDRENRYSSDLAEWMAAHPRGMTS